MSPLLEMVGATHAGRVRSHNEDWIAADEQAGFAVLADGMGGHNAGEVASRMAVGAVTSRLAHAAPAGGAAAEALIAELIAAANAAVFDAGSSAPECSGMGTTLVVAIWHADGVSCGHVGDSRLYRLRDRTLDRLTRDHSLVQEQLDGRLITAEQARRAPHRSVLTRAIGTDRRVEADVCSHEVRAGDLYLLCSDGLTDMLTDDEICATLLASGAGIDTAAARLVERANENGGFDNVSVVLVRVARSGED